MPPVDKVRHPPLVPGAAPAAVPGLGAPVPYALPLHGPLPSCSPATPPPPPAMPHTPTCTPAPQPAPRHPSPAIHAAIAGVGAVLLCFFPCFRPTPIPNPNHPSQCSYHEAWELSYFGANVLHPRTTLPAMRYEIPITIRNFFNLASLLASLYLLVAAPSVGVLHAQRTAHRCNFFNLASLLGLLTGRMFAACLRLLASARPWRTSASTAASCRPAWQAALQCKSGCARPRPALPSPSTAGPGAAPQRPLPSTAHLSPAGRPRHRD